MIIQSDSLEFLKSIKDYENDIIYADPPYQLGSEIIIRNDGKVDYKKSIDFMSKWDGLSGEYWEHWFKEAYRTLKHGGYLLMFGMDRQLLLFKYYAALAGFQEQQSLYWYYISNFPKATDLSKQIDKNAGIGREIIGKTQGVGSTNNKFTYLSRHKTEYDITKPATELAKKYEGYKYSISPLKQTCETIMVFKKPNKTGSVLHDTLAMENGDNTITCSALNIDGNRVAPYNKDDAYDIRHYQSEDCFQNLKPKETQFMIKPQPEGRYPAQTFIDSQVAERLDLQSGIKVSKVSKVSNKGSIWGSDNNEERIAGHNDIGGCSKILHKCDYEQIDFDLFIYQTKVSAKERNAGLDTFEDLKFNSDVPVPQRAERPFNSIKNNHPTLKPIALNEKILRLFKTPNNQKICYPFAGAGSEIIGGIKAGFDNWTACELNQEYIDIANARIEYWTKQKNMVKDIKPTSKANEVIEKGQVNLFDLMGD